MERSLLEEIKASIRSVLVSSTDKMTVLQIEKDFKLLMGSDLPYGKLGYRNTEHLLKSIPDVVKVHGCGAHAFVENVPNEKSEHIRNFVQNQKRDTKDRRPRRSGRKRNNNNSNVGSENARRETGNLNQLFHSQLYISKEQQTRNYNKQNYSWHTNSAESSPGGSSNESYSKENKNISNNVCAPIEEKTPEPSLVKKYPKPNTVNVNSKTIASTQDAAFNEEEAVPAYAMTPRINLLDKNHRKVTEQRKIFQLHTSYPPPSEVYDNLKIGSIISLYISEIHNPLVFFFHVNKDDHELFSLTKQMNKVYSHLAPHEHCVVDSFLQPGRICATKYEDSWYRAKILGVPEYINNFSKVKILLIDYGCITAVLVKNLKYLMSEFLHIPLQVTRGRLAYIKTVEPLHAATNYFQSLVQNRCIYAHITNINKDEPYVEMVLADTGVSPTLKINDHLIKKGFVERDYKKCAIMD